MTDYWSNIRPLFNALIEVNPCLGWANLASRN